MPGMQPNHKSDLRTEIRISLGQNGLLYLWASLDSHNFCVQTFIAKILE